MFKYHGGIRAGKGTYWNAATGERVDLEENGTLPGDDKTRYVRASGVTVLLFGPVLGLVFAIFLPFIGIAMTLTVAAKKIGMLFVNATAKSASFAWRPLEAYLVGRRAMRKREKHKPKQGAR